MTYDDFDDPIRLASAPRKIPLLSRLHLLFGNGLSQFGWIFFAMGMLAVSMFSLPATIGNMIAFSGKLEQARGTVIASEETNMEENEVEVYAIYFRFQVAGQTYKGKSYLTGRGLPKGRPVTVEYKANAPSRYARIRGLRATPFGGFILFVLLFPLVGLFLFLPGLSKGLRANHLLKEGKLAYARLLEMRETNTEINDEPVMELIFEFEADDGRTYQISEKTHKPDDLLDDEEERLLYDPLDPNRAVLFDNLPGTPEIDTKGHFVFSPWRGIFSLFLPACGIAASALVILGMLG